MSYRYRAMTAPREEHCTSHAPRWLTSDIANRSGLGVTVAVVDSGWRKELRDHRILPGIGFAGHRPFAVDPNADFHDRNGHGTACIGRIFALAPNVRVYPVRIFDSLLDASPQQLAAAIRWCTTRRPDIINLSLGTKEQSAIPLLYTVCEQARRQGITIVAAGDNRSDVCFPAAFDCVVGVDAARTSSPFTFAFNAQNTLECVADGVNNVPRRGSKPTTSFAAATVTGLLALLLAGKAKKGLDVARTALANAASAEGPFARSDGQPVLRDKEEKWQ
jgi:subtilisin family serine protease